MVITKHKGISTEGIEVRGFLLIDYMTGQWFIFEEGESVNEYMGGLLKFFAFEVIPNTVIQIEVEIEIQNNMEVEEC